MISEHDLDEAIAECLGQRKPNANTALKLAAFYTIRRELQQDKEKGGEPPEEPQSFSYSPPGPDPFYTVVISGDSDFALKIRGKPQADVWPVLDELMQTISEIYPRLYRATMEAL